MPVLPTRPVLALAPSAALELQVTPVCQDASAAMTARNPLEAGDPALLRLRGLPDAC